MTLQDIRDVRFSREATVKTPAGGYFMPFSLHSYVARVDFHDGEAVIVCLPKMAAQKPESQWTAPVISAALDARKDSRSVAMMAGSY